MTDDSLSNRDSLRILMVCMGNICRSPIAEVVLRDRIESAGLSSRVVVDSCGTGDWHEGAGADPRTVDVLQANGYSITHTARGIRRGWLRQRDLVLAMDHDNLRSLRRLAGGDEVALSRIGLLLAYDPNLVGLNDGDPLLEVPDPYFGGADGFRDVLTMIERSVDGLMSSYVIPHLGDDRRG